MDRVLMPAFKYCVIWFFIGLLEVVLHVNCTCLISVPFIQYRDNHIYSKADAARDFKRTRGPFKMIQGGTGGPPLTRIDDGALRGMYRKGKISGWETGFTWYAMNSRQLDEASMSYKIKFQPGFQWKKGGKLPGLCGGEGGRGTACPVGCSQVSRERGFSTRLMWREGGRIVTYAYYPDKPRSIRCGEDWKWSKTVKTGRWYDIRMWIKLNDPGVKNGEFKAWLDGEEVLHKKGIRYRYKSSFKISRTYITTYSGGSSVSSFASNQDQFIWFKDFETWSGGGKSPCKLSTTVSRSSSSSTSSSSSSTSRSRSTVVVRDSSENSIGTDDTNALQQTGVGTQRAPTASADIDGYRLFNEEAGWEIPGNIGNDGAVASREATGRQRLVQLIRYCARGCDSLSGCVSFVLNVETCWYKSINNLVNGTPHFAGRSGNGWRWFYIRSDNRVGAAGDLVELQSFDNPVMIAVNYTIPNGACGQIITNTNCNITLQVVMPEFVEYSNLKWWGLELLEKEGQTTVFNQLPNSSMGLCYSATASYTGEVTAEAVAQWPMISSQCQETQDS